MACAPGGANNMHPTQLGGGQTETIWQLDSAADVNLKLHIRHFFQKIRKFKKLYRQSSKKNNFSL